MADRAFQRLLRTRIVRGVIVRAGITAFSCGVILLYSVGTIPALPWLVSGIAVVWGVAWFTSRALIARIGVLAGWLLLGLAWSGGWSQERLATVLPAALEGRELTVLGHLCELPAPGSYHSVRFSLCVQQWGASVSPKPEVLPARLRLAWYGDDATLNLPHQLQLTVVLKQPHGSLNPAGFRYQSWLFRHGYGATGTVRSVAAAPQLECDLKCRFHRWRGGIARALGAALEPGDYRRLAKALLLGDRGELTPADWQVLKATGTIHLVAISGLHLGLIAAAVGLLVRWLLLALPLHWLSPRQHRLLVAASVASASLAYSLLAGFTVPTRRALIMVLVGCWFLVRVRQTGLWLAWVIALGLVLLQDPFSPLDRGFWLSFSAVAVLILVFARRQRPPGVLTALVLAQVAVFFILWPVLLWLGASPSLVGMTANLVAIPWLSLVVMPALLFLGLALWLFPVSAGWAVEGIDAVLMPLWLTLENMADWPVPDLPEVGWPGALGLAAVVLVCLLLPERRLRLAGGLIMVVSVAAGAWSGPSNNRRVATPEVWIWDVGQGLSVLVRHQDQALLYDTGPATPSGLSAVDSVVLPSLRRLGVGRLNRLLLSHGDSDHAGGLPQLFAGIEVASVYSGEPARVARRLPPAAPAVQHCEVGQVWQVGELEVAFWRAPGELTGNDASCVATVSWQGQQVVLPGDITAEVEANWLAQGGPAPAQWRAVVAPHHGSRTSSGPEWVGALAPELVVFSAGYRHRFGHPHPLVETRYREVGSRVLNTAHHGAVTIRFSASGPVVEFQRAEAPFWLRQQL